MSQGFAKILALLPFRAFSTVLSSKNIFISFGVKGNWLKYLSAKNTKYLIINKLFDLNILERYLCSKKL